MEDPEQPEMVELYTIDMEYLIPGSCPHSDTVSECSVDSGNISPCELVSNASSDNTRVKHLISAFYAPHYEEELERLFGDPPSGRSSPDSGILSSGGSIWDNILEDNIGTCRPTVVTERVAPPVEFITTQPTSYSDSVENELNEIAEELNESQWSTARTEEEQACSSPVLPLSSEELTSLLIGAEQSRCSPALLDILKKACLLDLLRHRKTSHTLAHTLGIPTQNSKKYATNSGNLLCVLCRASGTSELFYRSHTLKDIEGNITCPILFLYVCRICGASGKQAHTVKYCPVNNTKREMLKNLTTRL